MAARKLQNEIDKTLKKVQEGCELFDEIYDKMMSTTHQAQKEKRTFWLVRMPRPPFRPTTTLPSSLSAPGPRLHVGPCSGVALELDFEESD